MVKKRSSGVRLAVNEKKSRRAWRRPGKHDTGQTVGADACSWRFRGREEALQHLATLEAAWRASSNPAILFHALEGAEFLGVMPGWLGVEVRGVLWAWLGGDGLGIRSQSGRLRRLTGAAWWKRHQQDLVDAERRESVLEVRRRFRLTWEEAAGVVSREWWDGHVSPAAVLASVQRVERNIRAGREARYMWTSVDEVWRTKTKTDRRWFAASVKANAELTRILELRGKTRDDYYCESAGLPEDA